MSVAKREISLTEALGRYLSYTPNYAETEQFRTDLRTMNHTLLRDSIEECIQAKKAPGEVSSQTKRQLMHDVYMRKIKELASLYPFLFAVENALRSVAAERYATAFKNSSWWRIIHSAIADGKSANDFLVQQDGKKRVNNTPVNSAFVREVFISIERMSDSQRNILSAENCSPIVFYEEITLRNLANIIFSDWLLCPLGGLKKSDFNSHMNTICHARNEIFHSNPIKNRATVFTACERILDSVDVHLGDFDQKVRQVSYTRPSPSIRRNARHCIPPL